MEVSNKALFQFIDLTSLNNDDHYEQIKIFCNNAAALYKKGYQVAAVCVFPNFTELVKETVQHTTIKTAVVGAFFPNSQSFIHLKIEECKTAVTKGADEVDIVINLGALKMGDHQTVSEEIRLIKKAIAPAQLKVILETGQLSPEEIKTACMLSIAGGADFLKTSTGKISKGANPEAVEIMANTIKAHYTKTGDYIGLKVSGGVRTKADAMAYYSLVESILGNDFMTPTYFRIGASSLINDLLN
jgi:deoxyribose-phosphate aldolase